jgi:hypothetical protein
MFSLHPFISTALAAAPKIGPIGSPDTTPNGDISGTIASLFGKVLDVVLLIAGILAIFYLVYAGIMYITSAGAPDKVKTARATIINAVIGIIIITCTYTIIKLARYVGGFITTSTTTSASANHSGSPDTNQTSTDPNTVPVSDQPSQAGDPNTVPISDQPQQLPICISTLTPDDCNTYYPHSDGALGAEGTTWRRGTSQ